MEWIWNVGRRYKYIYVPHTVLSMFILGGLETCNQTIFFFEHPSKSVKTSAREGHTSAASSEGVIEDLGALRIRRHWTRCAIFKKCNEKVQWAHSLTQRKTCAELDLLLYNLKHKNPWSMMSILVRRQGASWRKWWIGIHNIFSEKIENFWLGLWQNNNQILIRKIILSYSKLLDLDSLTCTIFSWTTVSSLL